MDPAREEEMQAWLEEVDQVSNQIKGLVDGTISIEEVDKKEIRRQARKKREDEEDKRKEEEKLQKLKEGRTGKGEKENYQHFCKFCFREYVLPTPKCVKCGKDTETLKDRRDFLLTKVHDYQKNKTRKVERKKKWELWKKTKAMLWKKTATNYSKWDYYTSSSEEEDLTGQEPIVPSDDPQFKALEKDINDRGKRRKADKKIAEEYKEKGNKYMKEGDFEKAVLWYSEALEKCKDMKVLWTNRALAWIKLGYFKKAIKDCTRILEYCECFEEGYERSKEVTIKAFYRRSLAQKERKCFKEAMDDVNECLKLFPQDKDSLLMKQELEKIIEHQKHAKELFAKQQKLTQQEIALKQQQEKKFREDDENEDEEEQQQQQNTKKSEQDSNQNQKTQQQEEVQQNEKLQQKQNNDDAQKQIKQEQQNADIENKKFDKQEQDEEDEDEQKIIQKFKDVGLTPEQKQQGQDQRDKEEQEYNKKNGINQQQQKKQQKNEEKKNQNQKQKEGADQEVKDQIKQKIDELEFINSQKELSFIQLIDNFIKLKIEETTEKQIDSVRDIIIAKPEAKIYFQEKRGIQRIVELIKNKNSKCYLLLRVILEENVFYQNEFVKYEGIKVFHQRILDLVLQKKSESLDEVEDLFEVLLIITQEEQIRNALKDNKQVVETLAQVFDIIVPQFKKETPVVSTFLAYLSNLCFQQSKMKQTLQANVNKYFEALYQIFAYDKKKRTMFEHLRESAYNLFTNFLTEPDIRQQIWSGQYLNMFEAVTQRIGHYDLIKYPKYLDAAKSGLAVFVNATFQCNDQMEKLMGQIQIGETIYQRFLKKLDDKESKYHEILKRSIQILTRMDYSNSQLIENGILEHLLKFLEQLHIESGLTSKTILLYVQILKTPNMQQKFISYDFKFYERLCQRLRSFLLLEDLMIFCNSCTLIGNVIAIQPQAMPIFRDQIERLIYICKEKTGNLRKSAAILLAKLAKDQGNLELTRNLHGIEILQNISKFVTEQK